MRGVASIAVIVTCLAVLAVLSFASGGVPAWLALSSAWVLPVALIVRALPPRRSTAAVAVGAIVPLIAGVAVVAGLRARLAAGGAPYDAGEIARLLVVLCLLWGIVPAVVLGWAHAAAGGPRRDGSDGASR